MKGSITRASRLKIAYFAQHQLDELDADATRLRTRPRTDARRATKPRCARMAGSIGFSGLNADKKVEKLSGGEKARLMLGIATFGGAASAHPRRADQPSRHRQPHSLDRGDQRLSRRRDPGFARPPSARCLRRPALARGRRQGDVVRRRPQRLPPARAVRPRRQWRQGPRRAHAQSRRAIPPAQEQRREARPPPSRCASASSVPRPR